jgi:uracil-DNA glycosylase
MIIGAYPSARFESRLSPISAKRRLVPVADNLQPFGNEVYFDGIRVRKLESGAGLRQYLLEPLSLRPDECWITDLVKVFLYKPEHADSCADVVPGFKATVLRQSFSNLAKKKRNLKWVEEEYILCEPKVVVTLGEEVARVISGLTLSADELLVPKSFNPEIFGGCKTYFCPHPDACRRSAHWRERMREILQVLREELQSDG